MCFDFDGVIVNSEELYFRKLQKLLKEIFDLEASLQDLYHYIGLDLEAILTQVIVDYHLPITLSDFRRLHDSYGQNIYQEPSMKAEAGLSELLTQLREKGYRTCIVTSAEAADCLLFLNSCQLLNYFDAIFTQEMVDQSKPSPALYHLALENFGLPSNACVTIEDSPNGIKAAKAANIYTFAYTGTGIEQNITEADCILANFSDALDMISQLLD